MIPLLVAWELTDNTLLATGTCLTLIHVVNQWLVVKGIHAEVLGKPNGAILVMRLTE